MVLAGDVVGEVTCDVSQSVLSGRHLDGTRDHRLRPRNRLVIKEFELPECNLGANFGVHCMTGYRYWGSLT